MKSKLFSILLVVVLVGAFAYAEPTIDGDTGLIEMPTAGALRLKEWNFAFSLKGQEKGDPEFKYKSALGTFKGMELGFVGKNGQEGVFINAKFYLMSDHSEKPLGLAMGFKNLSSFDETSIYLVASKRFKETFTGHLGFSADMQDKVKAKMMTGTELFFWNSAVSFVTDIAGSEDAWRWNMGARFYLNSESTFGLYILDVLDSEESPALVGQFSWTDFM